MIEYFIVILYKIAFIVGVIKVTSLLLISFFKTQYVKKEKIYQFKSPDLNFHENKEQQDIKAKKRALKIRNKNLINKLSTINEKIYFNHSLSCNLIKLNSILENEILCEVLDINLIELIINRLYVIVTTDNFQEDMIKGEITENIVKVLEDEIKTVYSTNSVAISMTDLYLKTEAYKQKKDS